MRDEVDDTNMTAAEFRAARDRGTPTQVVRPREEFDAHFRHGGATFEVYEDRAGKFRFRLKASTGQVVATSEAYETKAAARRGAESVQSVAYRALIVEAAS
ncbi:MAG: YegP family protein [Pseudonocardiaceae bacterium]